MGGERARKREKRKRPRAEEATELLEKRGEEKPRGEERNVHATRNDSVTERTSRNTKGHAGKRINCIPRRCGLTAGGTRKWK